MPNGATIRSAQSGYLKLAGIPQEARKAYTFVELDQWSLLSLGMICDAGMKAYLDRHTALITYNGDTVLRGRRDETTRGMWIVELEDDQVLNLLYPTGTIAKLVQFYHGCFCSPSLDTFRKLFGLGINLPGITLRDVLKYPPISTATSAGHLDGTRWRRLRARLGSPPTPDDEGSEGVGSPPENNFHRWGETVVCKQIPDFTYENHMDSTGRYPIESHDGTNYVLVMFAVDANYIHMEPLVDKSARFFARHGCRPRYERLDNETSDIFEDLLQGKHVDVHFVTTIQHRANKAERAIRTLKGQTDGTRGNNPQPLETTHHEPTSVSI
jgi:hypothetical protein